MIEWPPFDNAEVVNVALPLLSVLVPSVVESSLNVTVPAGVPPLDVTVAVNCTDASNVDGFREEATCRRGLARRFASASLKCCR